MTEVYTFFSKRRSLLRKTRIAELIQIFNGSCEEFFHGFCQKDCFFFFSDGWCYNPSETHLQLHNFGTSHTLQGTITYPLQKKSIFSRWFSEIPRLVVYVSSSGSVTQVKLHPFLYFLQRFLSRLQLRAAKGGWGWGVLILWEKKPGPVINRPNGATRDLLALDTSEGRPIFRKSFGVGLARGDNNAIRWTFVLGDGRCWYMLEFCWQDVFRPFFFVVVWFRSFFPHVVWLPCLRKSSRAFFWKVFFGGWGLEGWVGRIRITADFFQSDHWSGVRSKVWAWITWHFCVEIHGIYVKRSVFFLNIHSTPRTDIFISIYHKNLHLP